MSGFHGAFATGVASQQGTLTLPDTWFRPPFWDLLMLQLLRPNSSNLPCLCSTFHLEYPLVLSRFYFKLRCDGNAICNVLQIASKFYHLKILKRRKKIDKRQNASLQSYLTMNSARHQSIRARYVKVPINTTIVQNAILPPHFCEIRGGGALKPIRPSVYWFVCPSFCLSLLLIWSVADGL